MIHTNRCKHCGKTKEEHDFINTIGAYSCYFTDSGLAALDAHKEELFEAVKEFKDAPRQEHLAVRLNEQELTAIEKVFSILNQIDKEK